MLNLILSVVLLIIILLVSTNIMLGSFVIYTLNLDPTLNILCLTLVLSDIPLIIYSIATIVYTIKLYYLRKRK